MLRCAMSKMYTKKNIFNKDWEQLFLFIENNEGDPVCMVCDYNAKRNHRHSIERHYNTCQKKMLNQNLDRAKLVDELKLKFQSKKQGMSTSYMYEYAFIKMSHKQTSSVTYQPQQGNPRAQDQRIILIRNVAKHPLLYKNEFLHTPFLHRQEKQQIWDKIAQESGFKKTDEAKGKWRSLIDYLRQHLDSVSQKKIRCYIPVTDNPEDKYVQLTDWSFYRELEFLVPYVKYADSKHNTNGKNRMEITPSEIDLIIDGIEAEINRKNEHNAKLDKDLQPPQKRELLNEKEEQQNVIKDSRLVLLDKDDDGSKEDDVILKEYFENMLNSTLKLPRFHQNRIKQKLLDCVNEQKELNKIN